MQFLRGDFRGERAPIRPPWSIAESEFSERCTRCGECIEHCPTNILRPGRGEYPEVDFSSGECEFCGDCAEACESGAIARQADYDIDAGEAPWQLTVTITDACIAFKGVVCRSCGEQCDARAISYRLVVGGAAYPELAAASCSGCGACVGPCPNNAIQIRNRGE